MHLDDIEFDLLNRADTLLLAYLRPRLWNFTLGADALADDDLRERLNREVERRAAKTGGERARLAFEQTEALPLPDFGRQTRLDALELELALERLRAHWLQCAATETGRAQLQIIEDWPLRSNNADAAPRPAWAKITLGLSRGFSDARHALNEVGAFSAAYLESNQARWSVTLSPICVHYTSDKGARDEAGIEIGLVNDPRAPLADYELARRALQMADQARQKFGQHRLCVTLPDAVVMLEGEDAPSPHSPTA